MINIYWDIIYALSLGGTIYNMVQISNSMIYKHLHPFFYCLYICSSARFEGIEDSHRQSSRQVWWIKKLPNESEPHWTEPTEIIIRFVSYSVDCLSFLSNYCTFYQIYGYVNLKSYVRSDNPPSCTNFIFLTLTSSVLIENLQIL